MSIFAPNVIGCHVRKEDSGIRKHLVAFFFHTAITRMKDELSQKRKNSLPMMFF